MEARNQGESFANQAMRFMNAVANTKFLRPDEQAFTRLELVVVVFVIALLTGTIFPGLANSGMNNRRLVCTNNLKQMGAATTMYANDNNDSLAPPPNAAVNNPSPRLHSDSRRAPTAIPRAAQNRQPPPSAAAK